MIQSIINIIPSIPNATFPRGDLYEYLTSLPKLEGSLCGDFNMIESKDHFAIEASLRQLGEKVKWELLQDTHTLIDTWGLNFPSKCYTYHSQDYKNAWARL